jgi:hypothetical protein
LLKFLQTVAELRALRKSAKEPNEQTYTPTGDVLDTLLLKYRRQIGDNADLPRAKKRVFPVITDGAASKSPCRPIRTCVCVDY